MIIRLDLMKIHTGSFVNEGAVETGCFFLARPVLYKADFLPETSHGRFSQGFCYFIVDQ